MKIAVKRLVRDEKGQTLILALILLVVGGLITAPLLAYMSTGLIAGQVYENKTAQLYAADAGAEDAVWKIQNQVDEVKYLYCGGGNHSWSYDISEVNGKNVAVTITWVNNGTYRVDSIATADGSGTEIEAYITGASICADYSGMTNHIVTTQGETDIAKKVTLIYPEGSEPVENYNGTWPDPWVLGQFYWQDVKNAVPYSLSTLDVNDYAAAGIGPFYRNGIFNNKGIINTGSDGLTLTLHGTVYITGDTEIGTTGNKDFILDLNGQTIFVSSNTSGNQKALNIGSRCSIQGPGAIIAVGDINFQPKAQVTTDPVFVLSVSGTTTMQPSGDFYGSLAGSVEVEIQQGTTPTITYPTGGFGDYNLNFPNLIQLGLAYSIASWEVNQQ
jgi:Tfp pilus assembly protein PilX